MKVVLDLEIPAEVVHHTTMTISHTIVQVIVNNSLTDAFDINVKLKQGDGLASLLVNLALEL